MTLDQVLNLIRISGSKKLSPLQAFVLRQSWQGDSYTGMTQKCHYEASYLKNVAFSLWPLLSDIFGEPINKVRFRAILEPLRLTATQQQSLAQQQFLDSLNNDATATTPQSSGLEFPSGPVPMGSLFYVARPALERRAVQVLSQPGGCIQILAPRQGGKSSLLFRLMADAIERGYRVVYLDLQQAEAEDLASLDRFLRWLCASSSVQLGLEAPKLTAAWNQQPNSKVSCSLYFKRNLLQLLDGPLMLALTEFDRLLQYPAIAQEVLLLLRSWQEEAHCSEAFRRLRVVISSSLSIESGFALGGGLFSLGVPIALPPFSLEQVQDLALRHGLDWYQGNDAQQLMALVGGQPYLVRLTLYHLAQTGTSLKTLLREALNRTGIYGDHCDSRWLALQMHPAAAAAFERVIMIGKSTQVDPRLACLLESWGLVLRQGNEVQPRCALYRQYFSQQFSRGEDLSALTTLSLLRRQQRQILRQQVQSLRQRRADLQLNRTQLKRNLQDLQQYVNLLKPRSCQRSGVQRE